MSPKKEAAMRSRKNTTITSEIMPTASWRSRRQASAQRPGESWALETGGFSRTALIVLLPSFEGHARVDDLVHHVHAEVDDHGDDREVHGDRLDHREIAAVHGGNDL